MDLKDYGNNENSISDFLVINFPVTYVVLHDECKKCSQRIMYEESG